MNNSYLLIDAFVYLCQLTVSNTVVSVKLLELRVVLQVGYFMKKECIGYWFVDEIILTPGSFGTILTN